ncbi:hypothetical protein BGZ73_004315 [Actinomortierella ambigua]|nr:hypothetical protein BGZ73_004315 [Actinomortierella ambigua]
MTAMLKISATLALLACAAHAAPLYQDASCGGSACDQSAHSGSVSLGSSTNIFPETNVVPITRYQPYVKSYAPVVDSECYYPYGGYGGFGGYGSLGDYGGLGGFGGYGGLGGYDDIGYGALAGLRGRSGLFKRQADPSLQAQGSQGPVSGCVPSETVSCDLTLPQSTVALGSQVGISPSTQVTPQTFYQDAVQSLSVNIDAAAAQTSVLPQESVSLGSNVDVQPVTQVLPQTFYQPALNSLATDIQAAPAQDVALPQSSVTLGSNVGIVPVTTVRPLTVFQPSIQSLPFIINAQTNCDQGFTGGAALGAGAMMGPGPVGIPLRGAAGAAMANVGASAGAMAADAAFGGNIPLMGSRFAQMSPQAAIPTSSFGAARPQMSASCA